MLSTTPKMLRFVIVENNDKQISRLYTRNIKYTIERHRESNKKTHTYSIVSGQFWQSTRHVVAGRIVECDERIQLFKLRII